MAAGGIPVTVVSTGGLPVVHTQGNGGTPATVVTAGGIAVTLVLAGGTPLALYDTSGNVYSLNPQITALAGSYTVTGVDGTLLYGRRVAADAGSYAVSGQAATLTYVGGAAWTGIPGSMQEIGYGSVTATWSSVAVNSGATDTVFAFLLSSDRDVSGVTIGGDAMTMLIDSPTGGPATGTTTASIWYKIGAYATPNIVVTSANVLENIGATFGKWTGASVVPSGEQLLDPSYRDDPKLLPSMTIPASGVGLCLAWTIEQAGLAFNNMTDGDIDTAASGNVRTYLLGSRTTAGAFQASFNTGENNYSGAIGCVLSPT